MPLLGVIKPAADKSWGDATMTLRTRLTEKLRTEHPVLLTVLKAHRLDSFNFPRCWGLLA
jgi:hypothetical protein